MILQQLSLAGVGPTPRSLVLPFAVPHGRPAWTVVRGHNGAGKTTLAHTLRIALFGARASKRHSEGYGDWLATLTHRELADDQPVSVSLRLLWPSESQYLSVELQRTWTRATAHHGDQLEVRVDGRADADWTANWRQRLEAVLPAAFADLTLLDGEQLTELPLRDAPPPELRVAIERVLGIGLIEQLQADLKVVSGRVRAERPTDDARVAEARQTVASLSIEVTERTAQLAKKERQRADARACVREADEAITAAAGSVGELRGVEQRHAEAAHERSAAEERLRELAEGLAPLLPLRTEIELLARRLQQEEKSGDARRVYEALVAHNAAVVQHLRRLQAPEPLIKALQMSLDLAPPPEPSGWQVPSGLVRQVQATLASLDSLRHEVGAALERVATAQDRLDTAEAQRDALVAVDSSGLESQRARARDTLEQSAAQLTRAEQALQQSEQRLQRAERELRDLEREVSRASATHQVQGRMLGTLDRVDDALKRYRSLVAAGRVAEVDRHLTELTRRLVSKPWLLDSVTLDPASLRLLLHGPQGHHIPVGSLSAGEQQLVVASWISALLHTGARQLPLVLDSLLGRLDPTARGRMLDTWLPQVTHQGLLLVTDAEWSPEDEVRLRDHVDVQRWVLRHDSAHGSVLEQEG